MSHPQTAAEIRAEWAAQDREQAGINTYAGWGYTAEQVKDAIVEIATDAHAEYPQYDGYWDGPEWVLAKITRRLRTKGGVRFERGDIVLVNLTEREPQFPGDVVNPTAYSVRGRINVSTPSTYFRLI